MKKAKKALIQIMPISFYSGRESQHWERVLL